MSVTAIALACAMIGHAADKAPAEPPGELLAAQVALSDGLFDVAALKTQRLLADTKLGKKQRSEIAALHVEALVRAGRGSDALAALKQYDITDSIFWQGQALLLTNDFDQASAILAKYPPDGPLAAQAQLAEVHALIGEGREGAARTMIKPLRASGNEAVARHARLLFNELEMSTNRAKSVLDRLSREHGAKDATVQVLRARAQMQLGDLKTSEAILRDLLLTGANEMSPLTHDAATVLLAETLHREGSAEARTVLLGFLKDFGGPDQAQSTEYWSEAFSLLERIANGRKNDDSLLSPVLAWASDSQVPERQGHALWYAASELHRRGRDTEALGLLEGLLQLQPHHPKTSDALRMAMQLHGAQKSDDRVLQLAERWRQDFGGGGGAVVDFLVGIIRFMRGENLQALASFTKAADAETDLPRRRRALYNAAICALKAGEQAALASLMTQLDKAAAADRGKKASGSETSADLELDHALQLASSLDPSAEEHLVSFIAKQAKHPRWVEANVALAEFCLLDVPPRVKKAAEALEAATKAAPPPALLERIGYVHVWLREAEQDLTAVSKEGQAFLAAWPESNRADEVEMKVAEAYYRLDNFAKARTGYELLARNHPTSPYADSAQFLAGMAAMAQQTEDGLNAAISMWDDLAQRGGPLAFAARRQQAVATLRKGGNQNALVLLSGLLDDPAAVGEERLSVQCDRAALLTTMGRKEPERYAQAVDLLRSVLNDKTLPYVWSARCGVLLATALREQKLGTEALEACHDVVTTGSNVVTAPQNPGEFLWYYRAGFLAIELLEESQQWEAAARMAERLAQSGGDRAAEAAKRATDIRLRHFLWDK